MKLLDLFCGAGGAAMGYHRAGFTEITGVDIKPQKRYPFRFVQGDALGYLAGLIESGEIGEYDMIHASPPCQLYSVTHSLSRGDYPDLVDATRLLILAAAKPYVIENVPGAPLQNPLLLCGSMFGLSVIRHRLFECRPPIWFPPHSCGCKHGGATGNRLRRSGVTKTPSLAGDGFRFVTVAGNNYLADEGRLAMGIDWMSKRQLSQAIPPAYTEWLGREVAKLI